ncbi:MAG: guanylate kinase [Chitinivibrionales bacterium]
MEAINKKGRIIIVSAASGAGKTSILKRVFMRLDWLEYSVSCTTRPKRAGEREGVDYFFLSQRDFFRMRDNGEFAEWKEVHGNYYGTPKSYLNGKIENGSIVVLDIDVQGRKELHSSFPEAAGIFIMPPSLEELERRLRSRGTDSSEVISLRMSNAKKEIEEYERCGLYSYTVVNGDLMRAVDETEGIIKKIAGRV